MKRLCALLTATVLLGGCAGHDRDAQPPKIGEVAMGKWGKLNIICIDGVQYLKGFRSISPYFDRNGRVRTCQ